MVEPALCVFCSILNLNIPNNVNEDLLYIELYLTRAQELGKSNHCNYGCKEGCRTLSVSHKSLNINYSTSSIIRTSII